MYVKLTTPIGEMAVVTDKAKRQAECLDVDAIGLISQVINTCTGKAHFTLAFGSVDSTGKFHIDPAHADNVANLMIDRSSTPATFDSFFMDAKGNARCDYPRSFYEEMMKALIPLAHKMIWGGTYPDMEVLMNGQLIFQPEHLKVA
jgi:hypothetical protein